MFDRFAILCVSLYTLIQAANAHVRDQWFHSIIWKVNKKTSLQFLDSIVIYTIMSLRLCVQKNLLRYHQITRRTTRSEVLLKEVKVTRAQVHAARSVYCSTGNYTAQIIG